MAAYSLVLSYHEFFSQLDRTAEEFLDLRGYFGTFFTCEVQLWKK